MECGLWVFNYIVDIVLFLFALFTLSKLHINCTKVASRTRVEYCTECVLA